MHYNVDFVFNFIITFLVINVIILQNKFEYIPNSFLFKRDFWILLCVANVCWIKFTGDKKSDEFTILLGLSF